MGDINKSNAWMTCCWIWRPDIASPLIDQIKMWPSFTLSELVSVPEISMKTNHSNLKKGKSAKLIFFSMISTISLASSNKRALHNTDKITSKKSLIPQSSLRFIRCIHHNPRVAAYVSSLTCERPMFHCYSSCNKLSLIFRKALHHSG